MKPAGTALLRQKRTSKMNKIITVLSIFILSILFFGGLAYAYTINFSGRAQFRGYFSDQFDNDGHNVLPILSGSQAIPSSVDTVSEFMTLLKDAYNSGTPQRHTGAAFIVNTMFGRPGFSASRTISSTDWTELTNRLTDRDSKGKINWNYSIPSGTCMSSYYQGDPGPDDDAFYDPCMWSKPAPSGPGIQIINDDGSSYILQRLCANPVGDIQAIDTVPIVPPVVPPATPNPCRPMTYTVKPLTRRSRSGTPTIRVTARNDATGRTVNFGYRTVGTVIDITRDCTTGDRWTVTQTSSRYIYRYSRVSRSCGEGCRYTVIVPRYRTDRQSTRYEPCYDFILTAGVRSLTPQVEANARLSVNTTMDVDSWTRTYYPSFYSRYRTITHSKNTEWQITQLKIAPGSRVPTVTNADSTSSPCTYYRSKTGIYACSVATSGTTVFNANGSRLSGSNPLSTKTYTIPDDPAGTKICYAFSARPSMSDPNYRSTSVRPGDYWNHSSISASANCTIVSKKPKVQITGGDVSVGKTFGSNPVTSNIQTSVSTKSGNRTFGSWVEYALFATGSSTGMASGSAFAGPGMSSATMCRYNTLSFTNSGSSSCTGSTTIGRYMPTSSLPDIAATFVTGTSTPNISSTVNLSGGLQGVYKASGNVTITGGSIAKGQWIVINAPSSNITITGDIRYTNQMLYSVDDIPQVVIIANNINIRGNVNQIDAWLVARGNLNTCSSLSISASLTAYDSCNEQLVANGPVMANRLYLRRTFGSEPGAGSGVPAEIFNLRPDAYLWSDTIATDNRHIQTVYSTELPARF
jgi:hypothetical protein